ncbi:MAG: restriction endonuclease subunit S [bacterium]
MSSRHIEGNGKRTMTRLKHVLANLHSGGTPDTNNDDYWSNDDTGIPWVAIGDMSNTSHVLSTEKRITEIGRKSKRIRVLLPGTLVYSMYASIGHVSQLKISAVVNQAILGFEFAKEVNQEFAKWWLRHLQPILVAEANSNTQDNLNAEKVRNLPFPVIALDLQQSISEYLDRETARIDALIAEKQMLELLRRSCGKWQLISQAVTKGLDPNVPMKPSGLDWLVDIPAHWG